MFGHKEDERQTISEDTDAGDGHLMRCQEEDGNSTGHGGYQSGNR